MKCEYDLVLKAKIFIALFKIKAKKAKKYSTLRRTVDALVESTDEGRTRRAIRCGELPRNFDPQISEWSNPVFITTIN